MAIGGFISTMRMSWGDLKCLAKLRDGKLRLKAQKCIEGGDWDRQYTFAAWFPDWLTSALRWGGACLCHEAEYQNNEDVVCEEKGRLLTHAHAYAEACWATGLATSAAWSCAEFGDCSLQFLGELQGAVRVVVGVGRIKLSMLNRLPLLLARVGMEAGVVKRCVDEYTKTPVNMRDDITSAFLEPGCPMRAQLDHLARTGDMSLQLKREIQSLCDVPFNDVVCEAPHAHAKRIGDSARRGSWAWLASSVRLKQNLEDAVLLPSMTGVDLQLVWNRWKSALQTSSKSSCRNKKIKRKAFLHRVYRVGTVDGFDAPEANDDEAVGDADGDGMGGAEVVEDAHGEPGPAGASVADVLNAKLIREYLEMSIPQHGYISAACPPSDDRKVSCFQVLHKHRRHVLPEDKKKTQDPQLDEWLVQEFEIWRGHEMGAKAPHLDVFLLKDPKYATVTELFGSDAAQRDTWRAGRARESDVQGCLCLQDWSIACPRKSLKDLDAPVLSLLDALEEKGWRGMSEMVWREQDALARVYDDRNIVSKRCYLQAVLAQDSLFAKGVRRFCSGKTAVYYKWLLRSPGAIDEALTTAELSSLVTAADESRAPALPSLSVLAKPGRALARLRVVDDPEVDGGAPGECLGDAPAAEPEDAAEAVDGKAKSSSSSSSDSSSSSPSSSGAVAGRGELGDCGPEEEAPCVFPDVLEGALVMHERAGEAGSGFRVRCPHHGCRAFRSAHMDVEAFGVMAPIFFLGSWLKEGAASSAAAYRKWRPKRADVRAYAEAWEA